MKESPDLYSIYKVKLNLSRHGIEDSSYTHILSFYAGVGFTRFSPSSSSIFFSSPHRQSIANMELTKFLNLMLIAGSAFASPYANRHFRREEDTCQIKLATSNGGRKIAIVLDSSGSMSWNDPSNLRIIAGKSLNSQLVPASAASGNIKADLVTVVDFDDEAQVIYPLGDPAGADSSFDTIDSDGGTWIAGSVLPRSSFEHL